jgi:hypothetical protein
LYDFEAHPCHFNFLDLKRCPITVGAVRHVLFLGIGELPEAAFGALQHKDHPQRYEQVDDFSAVRRPREIGGYAFPGMTLADFGRQELEERTHVGERLECRESNAR